MVYSKPPLEFLCVKNVVSISIADIFHLQLCEGCALYRYFVLLLLILFSECGCARTRKPEHYKLKYKKRICPQVGKRPIT